MKRKTVAKASTPAPARTVRDIMTTDVITATPETSVARMAQLMDRHAISGLPVVDPDHRVIGIVTDHDLIIRNTPIDPPPFLPLLEGRIPLETPAHFQRRVLRVVGSNAREVMSVDVTTISPDETLETLADLMLRRHRKLLPVVEGGRLAGVVSRLDLIRWMANQDAATAPASAR